MIKNYNPRPFEEFSTLPTYVTITKRYELLAKTKTGYTVRLAKLAVMNAMLEVGVEFEAIAPCHSKIMLLALGAWIQAKNPDIEQYELALQKE